MDPFANPTVLITRPKVGSLGFLAAVRALKRDFNPVISPAFELEGIATPDAGFDAAVFTSVAGVQHAPRGQGRTAWCVGDTTARAAKHAGYNAISASGAAEDLVALILGQMPNAPLVYFRGEVSKENISAALNAAGLTCQDRIVYRKVYYTPTTDAIAALGGGTDIILPLFSAETVSILRGWGLDYSRCHVVAISKAVSNAAYVLGARSMASVAHPDQATMAHEVALLIA